MTSSLKSAIQDESVVHGDPKLIEQAVVNLLDNAVKYTARGGQVRVEGRQLGSEEVLAGYGRGERAEGSAGG